jgi:hypothetical protein
MIKSILSIRGIVLRKYPIMPTETKNREQTLVIKARIKSGQFAPTIRRLYPTEVVEKKKGTRKAGREYFQACIIDPKGFPPVTAAAAEGDSPTGGETSERTAK